MLRMLMVVFPIGTGLFLTGLGTIKLNQATETPDPRPLSPYGILAFSSEECELEVLSIYFVDVLVKENLIKVSSFYSAFIQSDSKSEETFGFQIPHDVELDSVSVEAFSETTNRMVNVEVLDEDVKTTGNNTSLIYIKFVCLPELKEYNINFDFIWRDMAVKQSFSTYDLIVPISMTDRNAFQKVLPEVHPIECHRLVFHLYLPTDCEIVESIPPPKKEFYKGMVNRDLEWSLEELGMGKEELLSEVIRVRLELREEMELRGRLSFYSGLYMGIGVGLVFSGIHEALKITMELKRKSME